MFLIIIVSTFIILILLIRCLYTRNREGYISIDRPNHYRTVEIPKVELPPSSPTGSIGSVCAICCENKTKNNCSINGPCGHTFHTHCINSWHKIKTTCPLCRQNNI